ncbi:MAG: hypothetical protein GWO24_05530, partial [Akkermansiaceae bacterium]|nr:hypothetical protein [Akkermansiaceae bacterium]
MMGSRSVLGITLLGLLTGGGAAQKEALPPKTLELARQQEERDRTTWAAEVEAQRHEAVIIAFWDRLRKAAVAERLSVFADLPLSRISLGPMVSEERDLGLGIRETRLVRKAGTKTDLSPAEWREWLEGIRQQGFAVVQS